jgi:hypothetical protein
MRVVNLVRTPGLIGFRFDATPRDVRKEFIIVKIASPDNAILI